MSAAISHEERTAAHAAELAALSQKREAAIVAAETAAARARDEHEASATAAAVAFEAESEARFRTCAAMSQNGLVPLAIAFNVGGTRETANEIAANVRRFEKETRRLCGSRFASWGDVRGVLGNRLYLAFAAALFKRDPEALPCFTSDEHAGCVGHVAAVTERATAVCLNALATPSELIDALSALELEVAKVARGNRCKHPDDAERWAVLRLGSREAVAAEFARLREAENARGIERVDAHRAALMRARMGEDDPSWAPGWAAGIRKLMGRLVVRADGSIKPEHGF